MRSFSENLRGTIELGKKIKTVKDMKRNILEMKERLRSSNQYSSLFFVLFNDVNHPPRYIEWTRDGVFRTETWDPATNTYEPFSTAKLQNSNIGTTECCAIFLLFQDSYPNIYDFPNNTLSDVNAGNDKYKLILKKQFEGRTIIPAIVPNEPLPTPAPMQSTMPMYCPQCGKKLIPGSVFCPYCGTKVG